VHALAIARAKRQPLAAPAHIVLHIHITRDAAHAAPERLFGASAGVTGAFFAADGALCHYVCLLFFFFSTVF
jgi:hypothetical protein